MYSHKYVYVQVKSIYILVKIGNWDVLLLLNAPLVAISRLSCVSLPFTSYFHPPISGVFVAASSIRRQHSRAVCRLLSIYMYVRMQLKFTYCYVEKMLENGTRSHKQQREFHIALKTKMFVLI